MKNEFFYIQTDPYGEYFVVMHLVLDKLGHKSYHKSVEVYRKNLEIHIPDSSPKSKKIQYVYGSTHNQVKWQVQNVIGSKVYNSLEDCMKDNIENLI